MASDEVGDAIARHSISDNGGEDAAALFRNVDTSHKMPHAAHDHTEHRDSDDFAFADSILRLNPTEDLGDSRDSSWSEQAGGQTDTRRISLLDAVSLTVGLQVGSGIFSSPGVITAYTGSVGCSILVWVISGALAMTGASSFAELATAIPLNGGAQAYLQYSMGPLFGFLYSWTTIVALKPSSGAIIASILGEYATRTVLHILNGPSGGFHKYDRGDLPGFGIKTIGAFSVLFICFVLSVHRSLGTRFQLGITIAKVALLYTIPVVAIVVMAQGRMPTESKHAFATLSGFFEGSAKSPSRYALAFYSGLWAYDGWDQCTFVAGEIRNSSENVPRSIRLSSVLVTVSFTLTVIAYFATLPPALVASTNSVALDFGSNALGLVGGILFAAVVAISCLGALNGHLYTYSRLIFAAGQEGFLPSLFGTYHGYFRTPVNATLLGTVLILCFVIFGSGFVSLVNFCGVCAWFWYGMTVLGLLVLRVKEPDLRRPYKTWLITPIVFVAMAMFLLIMPIFAAPLEALAAFAFIGAGAPVYLLTQRNGQRHLYRLFPSSWRPEEDTADTEEAFELTRDESHGPEQK